MKMIEITFLGTSSMFPTKMRNHAALLLRREGDYMLFDCGEGTQRQLRIAGISPFKINHIFITHWHGDHSLGIGGIIQSMSANKRQHRLFIYGPEAEERVNKIVDTYVFHKGYDIAARDVDAHDVTVVAETRDWKVKALNVSHGTKCVAYRFEEAGMRKINMEYVGKFGLKQHRILGKLQNGEDIDWKGQKITVEQGTFIKPGKSIVYITDTRYFDELIDFAKDADVLICEATYSMDESKEKLERTHFTADKAAELARDANVKMLILTHFSQRYVNMKPLLTEAKKKFKNVEIAEDFMNIRI
jgi:ribonuclease Z